jgi:hypothetical protein
MNEKAIKAFQEWMGEEEVETRCPSYFAFEAGYEAAMKEQRQKPKVTEYQEMTEFGPMTISRTVEY